MKFYALNTNDTIRPSDVAGTGKFCNEEDGVLVLAKMHPWRNELGKGRIALSGHRMSLHEGVTAGSQVELIADQSGRRMGTYLVVGAKSWDGEVAGKVPTTKLRHYVMK